jgi:hypothetical protein
VTRTATSKAPTRALKGTSMSSTQAFRFDSTAKWTVWVGHHEGKPRAEIALFATWKPSWTCERWLDCELLSEAEAQAADWLKRRAT